MADDPLLGFKLRDAEVTLMLGAEDDEKTVGDADAINRLGRQQTQPNCASKLIRRWILQRSAPGNVNELVTLYEDLKIISVDTGLFDRDFSVLVSDEHARYESYVKAFAMSSPPDDRMLLRVVLRDPDSAVGEAAAVEPVRRRAQRHASYRSFDSCAAAVSDATKGRDVLSRRIQKWSEFKRITESGRLRLEALPTWLNLVRTVGCGRSYRVAGPGPMTTAAGFGV
jgi:hypothetical protein